MSRYVDMDKCPCNKCKRISACGENVIHPYCNHYEEWLKGEDVGPVERWRMKVEGCDIVNNAEVYGLQESIRGAKFPMSINVDTLNSDLTNGIKNLAQSPSGEGHDQWLTGVVVQFDLTFSIKAWVEAERYHFFDFVSSQSTMHRITKMPVESQMNQYVDQRIVSILREHIDAYNNDATPQNYLRVLYNVPTGFKLTARMTTNYRQLKTIYRQRKTHRLPQWRKFCEWIETLPMHELITGELE